MLLAAIKQETYTEDEGHVHSQIAQDPPLNKLYPGTLQRVQCNFDYSAWTLIKDRRHVRSGEQLMEIAASPKLQGNPGCGHGVSCFVAIR